MPPESVRPATPVADMRPPGVARSKGGRRVYIAPDGAAFDDGAIETRRHAYGVHERHVDHQSAFAHGITCNIVAARAYRDGESLITREIDRRHDIGGVRAACDKRGTAVDHAVPYNPRRIIRRVRRLQHFAAH